MLTVEGITTWLSHNMEDDHSFFGTGDAYINLWIELMFGNLWYMCLQSKGKMEFLDRWVISSHGEAAA